MAVYEHVRQAPFGAETILKIVSYGERALDELRVTLKAQRIYRELRDLSAQQLTDIGLGDRELYIEAREIARRSF